MRRMQRVRQILRTYNPVTAARRKEIKKFATRSGPVARTNTDSQIEQSSGTCKKWKLEGWRFGVFLSIIAVTICLVAETIMLALAMSLNKPEGKKDGIGLLHVGECKMVERINNLLAILLNIIATVLVSASNYVMQCLCSPSRSDIDEAHSAGSSLNIGRHSLHNLFRKVSWKLLL